jgi:multiple sugar transport system ATP-binding protein
MNLYEATMSDDARSVKVGSQVLPVPDDVHAARPGLARYGGKPVVLGVRPEHLPAARDGMTGPRLVGNVDLIESLGSELVVHFTIDAPRVQPEGASIEYEDATAKAGEGVARVAPTTQVKVGEQITFAVNTEGMQFFDKETDKAIWD